MSLFPPRIAAQAPVQPGDLIDGKYLVSGIIGSGGMGVVVAAKHLMLDQRVALKFLLPRALSNPDAKARFIREAKAVARLRGNHVARVFDTGVMGGGAPYIAMELLDGKDLGQVLAERGALPLDEAVDTVLQACEAVAEAHREGIVHRDLKPQNLFVTQSVLGEPLIKVLDFGISKVIEEGDAGLLTATANLMGSPAYMPPEQMRSAKNVSFASDLWSLGVILYEVVTGRLPFEGSNVPELCVKVTSDEPIDPIVLRPELPKGLRDVILRLLRKDPKQRFASVAELAAALQPFAVRAERGASDRVAAIARGSGPPPSRSSGPPGKVSTHAAWGTTHVAVSQRRRPWVARLAAGGLAAGLGLGYLALRSGSTNPAAGVPAESAPLAIEVQSLPITFPSTEPPRIPPPAAVQPATAVPRPVNHGPRTRPLFKNTGVARDSGAPGTALPTAPGEMGDLGPGNGIIPRNR